VLAPRRRALDTSCRGVTARDRRTRDATVADDDVTAMERRH